MKIKGVEGLTVAAVRQEVANGGKFVIYQYCISIVILTFRRSSDIYFVRAGENAILTGLPFSLLSLFLGWWGIPWGPIYTVMAFVNNFQGGKNVTNDVMSRFSS